MKLFLLFLFVPVIEIMLLFFVGARIGFIPTIVLIVVTAIIGAKYAKSQGLKIISEIQGKLSSGVMPKDEIIEGAIILVGSVLLLTPGVLTDVVGFSCLSPVVRKPVLASVKGLMSKKGLKKDEVAAEYEVLD
ncbi:MAG: FxsA family protein [Fibrobacterales bacterium]